MFPIVLNITGRCTNMVHLCTDNKLGTNKTQLENATERHPKHIYENRYNYDGSHPELVSRDYQDRCLHRGSSNTTVQLQTKQRFILASPRRQDNNLIYHMAPRSPIFPTIACHL